MKNGQAEKPKFPEKQTQQQQSYYYQPILTKLFQYVDRPLGTFLKEILIQEVLLYHVWRSFQWLLELIFTMLLLGSQVR